MNQPAPTFNQIRARVRAVRRKVPDARVVGIRSLGRYAGERIRQDGPDTYRVEQCDSPLAARIALLDEEPGVTVTVLVTALSDNDLGDDVLVRLAGRKLNEINPWEIVKDFYAAQAIDPRLRGHPWVADRLLELAPMEGTAPTPGGYLDAEQVWPLLLNRLVGLEGERPDLPLLLRWSAYDENVQRFRRLPEEARRAAEGFLAEGIGPAVSSVLRCVVASEQPDTLPVGLVLGVVHHPGAVGRLDRAAGRLERFLGGQTPEPPLVERWHAAAAEAVRLLGGDRGTRNRLLHRAESILREVQAEDHAHLSDVLPLGLHQRLARLGGLLGRVTEGSLSAGELAQARESARRHDEARREPRQVERVDMALRLARWLAQSGDQKTPQSLGEASRDYLAVGSFVDWARSILRGSEQVRELADGYARLVDQVTARREAQNRVFAELLRDQTASANRPADLVPVERILDEVVAPLAALAPVLVILLDGMSPAVSRELLDDLGRLDWVSLGPEGRPVRPGLAAVPCVTEASRASLFCGKPRTGTAGDEAAGFASHQGLKAHCRSGQPPVLFHKVGLQEAGGSALAAEVREAVASPQKRVVAVVVNAIYDILLKGEQLDQRWTRDEIKVLPSLLYEARSARRIVVLLSDHGHLLDRQTEQRPGEGGERWRPEGQVGEGELLVQGTRVLLAEGHRLIAPWSERVRYGARKNGYHGGLTPQEMVIPITVLASADLLKSLSGWSEVPDPTPDWWEDAPAPVATAAPLPADKPLPKKVPETLWDLAPDPVPAAPPPSAEVTPSRVAWVGPLLASGLFAEQKKLGGRAVPGDEVFADLLAALDAAGGKLTATALARRLSLPLFRLRGLLAVVQRVLNIDGFAVLGRDEQSDTVELNRLLLLRQFDLIEEGEP
ncbi:MAG: BREX-2 system phosphatase PglZ [Gemmataceae bacterium]